MLALQLVMLPLQVFEDGGACFVILQIFSGDLDVAWLDCVCLGGLLLVAVLLEIFELKAFDYACSSASSSSRRRLCSPLS